MAVKISDKKTVEFEINGAKVSLTKPTLGAQVKYEQDLLDAKDGKTSVGKAMKAFIVGLGMPEDVADTMDMGQFNDVIEALVASKKN